MAPLMDEPATPPTRPAKEGNAQDRPPRREQGKSNGPKRCDFQVAHEHVRDRGFKEPFRLELFKEVEKVAGKGSVAFQFRGADGGGHYE